jgi:hypothetical protein
MEICKEHLEKAARMANESKHQMAQMFANDFETMTSIMETCSALDIKFDHVRAIISILVDRNLIQICPAKE